MSGFIVEGSLTGAYGLGDAELRKKAGRPQQQTLGGVGPTSQTKTGSAASKSSCRQYSTEEDVLPRQSGVLHELCEEFGWRPCPRR